MTVVSYGVDALDGYSWVLWRIAVLDPGLRAGGDVAGTTQKLMTDACAALDCVYDGCGDDDSFEDGTRYYGWTVRVPRDEHQRKNADGVPVVVARLQAALRRELPAGLGVWSVQPEVEQSYRMAVGAYLREAYTDLLDPWEAALMPWRRDGAESLEPRVGFYGTTLTDGSLVAHPVLWLSTDPPGSVEPRPWLVLRVGVVADRLPAPPAGGVVLPVDDPNCVAMGGDRGSGAVARRLGNHRRRRMDRTERRAARSDRAGHGAVERIDLGRGTRALPSAAREPPATE